MKRDTLLWLLLGLAALAAGTGAVMLYSGGRGIRNNNPGNIRKGATVWQGQSLVQDDPAFLKFDAPEFGIRAMARVLTNYMAGGINTVASIISRWAPSSENDTATYIADVAARAGVNPNAPLSQANLASLIPAIIHHENGTQPYPPELIAHGIALAA